MIELVVELTDDQAEALAQMCKRATPERVALFAIPITSDGGHERDLMLSGLIRMESALNNAGYCPR